MNDDEKWRRRQDGEVPSSIIHQQSAISTSQSHSHIIIIIPQSTIIDD